MDLRSLSFPEAPLMRVEPPGPRSQEYLKSQRAHESSAVSYSRGMPMAVRRGRGATVEDVDGNVYIDFFAGAGVLNFGHSNPDVIAAAKAQIDDLTHTLDIPSPPRQALMDKLRERLPPELTRCLFGGPTGSDAVESAMKLAKFNTGRPGMIAFEGSYHGMTAGALSLTSGRSFRQGFLPLLGEIHFLPYAYCYRCAFGRKAGACDLECAAFVDHVLEDPHSGVGRPAALIVEAVQGEGGTIVPPREFLPRLAEACRRHEVLLIVDEVQAGFGRTGRMFAFEHSETVPDIMVMSKALGGAGFPISAIAYREKLDTFPPGKHIGTFRGNVIAFAAGAAALGFMDRTDLAGHAAGLGEWMLGRLKELESTSPIIGEARGLGLMMGVEFVKDKATKAPASDLAKAVRGFCHKHGLLIEVGGHYDNVARFLPPLVLTRDLAEKGLEVFAEAVRQAAP